MFVSASRAHAQRVRAVDSCATAIAGRMARTRARKSHLPTKTRRKADSAFGVRQAVAQWHSDGRTMALCATVCRATVCHCDATGPGPTTSLLRAANNVPIRPSGRYGGYGGAAAHAERTHAHRLVPPQWPTTVSITHRTSEQARRRRAKDRKHPE